MHIAVLGPIATADVTHLLDEGTAPRPVGYSGAPLMGALIAQLLEQGHSVTAITLSTGMPLRANGVQRARGPSFEMVWCPLRPKAWPMNGWRLGRILDLFAFERALMRKAIEAAAPDVVHAHWAYEFAWAAISTGLPHVVTSHDSPFVIARYNKGLRLGGYRWLRALMAWHVLRRARCVSTVSPYMQAQIQPLCRVPVALVPNPVNVPSALQHPPVVPGRQRVLMVCNGWSERKNPEPALRAFAQASRGFPGAELVMLGADFGPGQAASAWWVAQGLQGQVRFLGAVSHSEVLQWMAQSDVLLHPALEESFGAVLAEALALGLPVIAGRDSGAVPWVVGDNGRLVDVSSAQAIAGALEELLADDALREQLGREGRIAVEQRFGVLTVSRAYEALYRSVIAREPTLAII